MQRKKQASRVSQRRRARPRGADVIATRVFTLQRGSNATEVTVTVCRPTREPTGEYRCVYEIREGRKVLRKTRGICGEDSLQALLLALGMTAVELDLIARGKSAVIERWQLLDLRKLMPNAR